MIFNDVLRFGAVGDVDAPNLTFVYKFFWNSKADSCF